MTGFWGLRQRIETEGITNLLIETQSTFCEWTWYSFKSVQGAHHTQVVTGACATYLAIALQILRA